MDEETGYNQGYWSLCVRLYHFSFLNTKEAYWLILRANTKIRYFCFASACFSLFIGRGIERYLSSNLWRHWHIKARQINTVCASACRQAVPITNVRNNNEAALRVLQLGEGWIWRGSFMMWRGFLYWCEYMLPHVAIVQLTQWDSSHHYCQLYTVHHHCTDRTINIQYKCTNVQYSVYR